MTRLLYAIQGTGNGHLARAQDVIPTLKEIAKTDILVSGLNSRQFLDHEIKFRLHGISYVFGKNGSIDFIGSLKKLNILRFLKEVKRLPVEDYDLVISDFEPVSSWASWARQVPCMALSHQSAVLHPSSPKPPIKDQAALRFMKFYAPSDSNYGFHFKSYAQNIFTPVIRQAIRELSPTSGKHYTVYLPAYSDNRIYEFLSQFPLEQWHVFSKQSKTEYQKKNVTFKPVGSSFLSSFAQCRGIMCGAGFETPAEAIYLRKKLLVIPMKAQFEQQCNAASLKALGVPVIKNLSLKYFRVVDNWLKSSEVLDISYTVQGENIKRVVKSRISDLNAAKALV